MLEQFDTWSEQPMSREDVIAVSGMYEQYNYYEQPVDVDIDLVLAGQFVQSFRMYYKLALNESNFYCGGRYVIYRQQRL